MCGEDERSICAWLENRKPEVFDKFRHCEILIGETMGSCEMLKVILRDFIRR